MMIRILSCLLAVGCIGKDLDSGARGHATKDPLFPFPSMHQMVDGHVAFPDELPQSLGGHPIETERIAWRTGFSVAQVSVIDPGVLLDPASLPSQANPVSDGSVQLWDLTDGVPVRCFAEIDAYPALGEENPTLLVRPMDKLSPGHQHAVVLTDAVRTAEGDPMPPLPWFTAVLDGTPGPELEEWVDHYQGLVADLAALGVHEPVLAFDFPVSDGGRPVRAVAEEVGVPSAYTFTDVVDTDDGVALAPGAWRRIEGHFTTDNWLVDDVRLELEDGVPVLQGTVEAELYIYMPESVRDAAPGTVPVWLFGHGLFGVPDEYLGHPEDPSKVMKLASEAEVIVVATVWRGFRTTDRLPAIEIAKDFAELPMLTERLTQGVANVIALSRLVLEGELLDDPELRGLPAKGALRYYGISLGGIAGAVMLANNDRIDHGVLHVGGSAWSTMLERSSQWIPFDWVMQEHMPSPRMRQWLYALSQLFWDPVDPLNHTDGLKGRSLLWQEAIGDEQVANMTTEMLARAVGAVQLAPVHWEIEGLVVSDAPLSGPAISQLDPQTQLPAHANRPAAPSGAHSVPRTWPGARQQTAHFLDWNLPGTAAHFCGETVCSVSNPGH
jgi:hypothetical protein